jgi:uncharacterized protein (UPF0332 family)
MITKELDGAKNDLETAKKSLKTGDYKWATVQAYYSIFHAARALLYNKDFRERSHRGLLSALKLLYPSKIIGSIMEDFSEAMRLREQADYGLVYSEDSARVSVEDAKSFLEETTKILDPSSTPEKKASTRRLRASKPLAELRGAFKDHEKLVREGIRELEREHRKEARS